MSDQLAPRPADRFTFGLWTVGNNGHDVAGDATRPPLDIDEAIGRLAELGAYGVSYHDDDLLRPHETHRDRGPALRRFRTALEREGLVATMATTNLAQDPAFKDGALTAPSRPVRRAALAKILDAVDAAADLGVEIFVYWGARDGSDTDAGGDPVAALDRYRDGINAVVAYIKQQKYPMRLALEPQPTETRADVLLPTVGHALAFISTLDEPDVVGVNPEVGHEQMSGLSVVHAVAQAQWHRKLFHIDLNAQRGARFGQELRFGSEDLKGALLLVNLLETSGYTGPKNFDAHPYRCTSGEDVWRFAAGCMRTYLALRQRAAALRADPAYQKVADDPGARQPLLAAGERPGDVRQDKTDLRSLRARPTPWEVLDQLAVEYLMAAVL